MPHIPFVLPANRHAKKPEWLNDPLNYHDRGDIDFSSCSQVCFEQGDFFGLDDLFTEKPNVRRGLGAIFASWVTRYKLDGFRVDTARHVNAAFFRLWVPQILAAARAAGVPDFQIFGEVFDTDVLNLAPFVRDRGLPNVLDFPFQDAAAGFAPAARARSRCRTGWRTTTTFGCRTGARRRRRRSSATTTWAARRCRSPSTRRGSRRRAAQAHAARVRPAVPPARRAGRLLRRRGRDDRLGRRPGRARGHVPDEGRRLEDRGAGREPPIGNGSSFDVTSSPIQTRLRALAKLREDYPELAAGQTIVRSAKGKVLVVSRIDAEKRRELLVAFNAGDTAASVTVPTARRRRLAGGVRFRRLDAGQANRVALSIPAATAVVYASATPIAVTAPRAPTLKVGAGRPDELRARVGDRRRRRARHASRSRSAPGRAPGSGSRSTTPRRTAHFSTRRRSRAGGRSRSSRSRGPSTAPPRCPRWSRSCPGGRKHATSLIGGVSRATVVVIRSAVYSAQRHACERRGSVRPPR